MKRIASRSSVLAPGTEGTDESFWLVPGPLLEVNGGDSLREA
jgi:hypothetical protein